jgi:XisI protein
MDQLEHYRDIVCRLVEEYASYKPSHGQIESEAIMDRARDHYEVVHVGWDNGLRVHGSVVHIDIRDGKIWIQYDGTSQPVAEELVAAGIPKEAIVLAFHPMKVRHLTGYGVS